MTAMPALRDIQNDTPASAIDVDFNFGVLEAHVGSELVNRDGSVAMLQPLNLAGPAPSQPNHAATKSYVDQQIVPIGTIWLFAGGNVPTGWAFCDGAEKSKTDPAYVALFNVIGYTYGTGTGTNFLLPNLQGRFPVGRQASDPIFDTLNDKGGSKDAALPSHTHSTPAHQHTATTSGVGDHTHQQMRLGSNAGGYTGYLGSGPNIQSGTVDNTYPAGAHSHSVTTNGGEGAGTSGAAGVGPTNANLPPYITLNFIIRIGI
jgi:microcystin-dependent protein